MLKKGTVTFKAICLFVAVAFTWAVFLPDFVRAQSPMPVGPAVYNLPLPKQFIPLSKGYSLPLLKGLQLNPNKPLELEFFIDPGDKGSVSREETAKLVKYFLAGLTIPRKDLWVNLSPYEKDRTVSLNLGDTDMGKDLLAQDYLLKQLTASLTYPEGKAGKDYWREIYKEVFKLAGTANIPIDSFNKVWIVPDIAEVYEHGNTVLITDSSLEVMLEEDYLAIENHIASNIEQNQENNPSYAEGINRIASKVMKQVILPKINRDINYGRNFAVLRQIYHSLILGIWFKQKFQDSFYRYYINQSKTAGIGLNDKTAKEKIYKLYVEAFKKGLYNYVKKDYDSGEKRYLQRRYYSGGFSVPEQFNLSRNSAASPIEMNNLLQKESAGKKWEKWSTELIGLTGPEYSREVLISEQEASSAINSAEVSREDDRVQRDMLPLDRVKKLRHFPLNRYVRFAKLAKSQEWVKEQFESLYNGKSKVLWYGKKKSLKKIVANCEPVPDKTHKFQQSGEILSAADELIDNAVDSIVRDIGYSVPLGKFGEGSSRASRLIDDDLLVTKNSYSGDYVVWSSSTSKDRKSRNNVIYKHKGEDSIDFYNIPNGNKAGTHVKVRSSKLRGRRQELEKRIRDTYEDSLQLPIYLNGEFINDAKDMVYVNGEPRSFLCQDRVVQIITYEDGFEVLDDGPGMEADIMAGILPVFRRGVNQELRRELAKQGKKDKTALLFHKQTTLSAEDKMKVRFVVGKAMDEDCFEVEAGRLVLPRKIVLQLPAFTDFSEVKNEIIADDLTKQTVDYFTDRIINMPLDNSLAVVNGFAQALKHLQAKVRGKKYDFISYFVEQAVNKALIPYAQKHNVIYLPNTIQLAQEDLNTNQKIVYLDDIFFEHSFVLWDSCFEPAPFTAGRAYYIGLSEKADPFISFGKSIVLVDDSIAVRLKQASRHSQEQFEQAVEYFNAALKACGVKGELSGSGSSEEESVFEAALNRLEDFQQLPSSDKKAIAKRVSLSGIEPAVLEEEVNKLDELVKEERVSEKPIAEKGEAESDITKLEVHTKESMPLAPEYEEYKTFRYLGEINGESYFALIREPKKKNERPVHIVVNANTGKVVFDSALIYKHGLWSGDFKISIRDNQLVLEVKKVGMGPFRHRFKKSKLTNWEQLRDEGFVFDPGSADEYIYPLTAVLSKIEDRYFELTGKNINKANNLSLRLERIGNVFLSATIISAVAMLPLAFFKGVFALFSMPWLSLGLAFCFSGVSSIFSGITALVSRHLENKNYGGTAEIIRRAFFSKDIPVLAMVWHSKRGMKAIKLFSDKKASKESKHLRPWFRIQNQGIYGQGPVYYGHSQRGKTATIERIETEPYQQRKVIFRRKNCEVKDIRVEGSDVFFIVSEILKTGSQPYYLHIYDSSRDKLERFCLALGKGELKFKCRQGNKYYFLHETDDEMKAITFDSLRGMVTSVEAIRDNKKDKRIPVKESLAEGVPGEYSVWRGSFFYTEYDGKNYNVIRDRESHKETLVSLPGHFTDGGDYQGSMFVLPSNGRYELWCLFLDGFEEAYKDIYILDKEKGKIFYMTRLRQGFLPSGMSFSDGNIRVTAFSSLTRKNLILEAAVPEESLVEVEQKEDNQYARHFLDNLRYAPFERVKSYVKLFPYLHYEVLEKLSPETLKAIDDYIAESKDDCSDFLMFFSVFGKELASLPAAAGLDVIVSGWLEQFKLNPEKAKLFLSSINRRYRVKGELLSGAQLLKSNPSALPAGTRSFWLGLTADSKREIPSRDEVTHLFKTTEVLSRMQNVPLARLQLVKDKHGSSLDGIEKLDDYKVFYENTSGNDKDYDGDIQSAIEGQNAATLPRELHQNASDAVKASSSIENTANKAVVRHRIYLIKQAGKFKLFYETQDNGTGIYPNVAFSRTFPLDYTTKKRHMGQGWYTIWAEAKPGEEVDIETSQGQGIGHIFNAEMKEGERIVFDNISEVQLSEREQKTRGTLVRRSWLFDTEKQARDKFGELENDLKFFCGAERDVDTYLNNERINEDLELGDQQLFGELGVSEFFWGGNYNRVVSEGRAMPTSLDVATMRRNYWPGWPQEVQEELLSQGVTTSIAPGILLTKARTGPAYEEYWPYIRRCEILKAMLAMARGLSRLKHPVLLENIKAALEKATQDKQQDSEADRIAYYLNYSDSNGQKQFNWVSREAMLKNWYDLMVRLKFDVREENGSIAQLSLVDIYRRKEGIQQPESVKYDLSHLPRFELPQVQYEQAEQDISIEPAKQRGFKPGFGRRLVNWFKNAGYEIKFLLGIKSIKPKVVGAVVVIVLVGYILLGLVGGYIGSIGRGKGGGLEINLPLPSMSWLDKLWRGRMRFHNEIVPWSSDSLLERDTHGWFPWFNKAVYTPGRFKQAYIVAKVRGLRKGELAIVRYQPNISSLGAYGAQIDIEPQGDYTGEEVIFDMVLGSKQKGQKIGLLQVADGVPEFISFSENPESFDTSNMDDGYITVKGDVAGRTAITVVIPRRDRPNKLIYDREADSKHLAKEFAALNSSRLVLIDTLKDMHKNPYDYNNKEKEDMIDDWMRNLFGYDDTQGIVSGDTWIEPADKLYGKEGRVYSFCEYNALYKQIFLEYLGMEGLTAEGYVYKGRGILGSNTGHVDSYRLVSDGTIIASPWKDGHTRRKTQNTSIDGFFKDVDGKSPLRSPWGKFIIFTILAGIPLYFSGPFFRWLLRNRLQHRGRGQLQQWRKPAAREIMPLDSRSFLTALDILNKDLSGVEPAAAYDAAQKEYEESLSNRPLPDFIGKIFSEAGVTQTDIRVIFDPAKPRFIVEGNSLKINGAYYPSEFKRLNSYLNNPADSRLARSSLRAVALQASYELNKESNPGVSKLRYYINAVLRILAKLQSNSGSDDENLSSSITVPSGSDSSDITAMAEDDSAASSLNKADFLKRPLSAPGGIDFEPLDIRAKKACSPMNSAPFDIKSFEGFTVKVTGRQPMESIYNSSLQ